LPDGDYEPPASETAGPPELVVAFHGEDGRRKDYRMSRLPLPGWHPALAAAFAERIGPGGTRRTLRSAEHSWGTLLRFMRFLAELPDPPAMPAALTIEHLDSFRAHRSATIGDVAWMEFREICLVAKRPAIAEFLDADVRNYLLRRIDRWQQRPPNPVTPTASSTGSCERPVPTSPGSATASERVGTWLLAIDTTRTQSLPTIACSPSNSRISLPLAAYRRCGDSLVLPPVAILPRTCF